MNRLYLAAICVLGLSLAATAIAQDHDITKKTQNPAKSSRRAKQAPPPMSCMPAATTPVTASGTAASSASGTGSAPAEVVTPAQVPAPGRLPDPQANDLAGKHDVEITNELPAPVTEPGSALSQTTPPTMGPSATEPELTPEARGTVAVQQVAAQKKDNSWTHLEIDPDAYSVVSSGKGLSLHKPMFVLPYTYSEEYHGKDTEVLFQISLKQRLFGVPLYLAYTQKAFWQAYNSMRSSPFRETDYNPELFYRYIPADRERWHHLGVDVGFEHESNGKDLPDSRSWNRLYVAPFYAKDETLVYAKLWYRIPENKSLPRTDPDRDDNPDIQSYYGYGEVHVEQQIFDRQLVHLMFRYNPTTARGGLNLQYTVPDHSADPSFFYMFYLFQGYGEDLLNYNHSVFRVGVGLAVAR